MKKLYTLVAVLVLTAITAHAQNLLASYNPGFEDWDNETTPTGYEPYTSSYLETNQGLMREGTIVHDGTYSVKQVSKDSPTQGIEIEPIAVTPGHSYTISYWYMDNDDNASTRLWSSWLNDAYSATGIDQSAIQETAYSDNNPEWIHKEVTATAPADVAYLRFQVRTYRQSTTNSGGYIYYDTISVIDNTTAGTKDNSISGLKMYPNPVSGTILNISSDSNTVKTVTVYDVLGKEVINTQTTNGIINVANLNAGVYIVKITEDNKTATRKLVVK